MLGSKGMANLLSQPERPAMIVEVSALALKQLGGPATGPD
jgi:hypothetical protein